MIYLLYIPSTLLWAWTLGVLYGWFIIPLGAPALSLPHLYGLSVIAQVLTIQSPDTDKDAIEIWAFSVTKSAVALVVGWVAASLGGLT